MTKIDYIITGLLYCAVENLQTSTPYERFPEPDSLRYQCGEALAALATHQREFDGIALFKLKWRLLSQFRYHDGEYQVLTWTGSNWQVQA